MKSIVSGILGLVVTAALAGCAGQTEQITIIDQYLVNVPHRYYKVYGLGDIYSPKGATLTVDQRYQNVRIVAVYQTDQVPVLPAAQRS
jgi:hypothetical protein